MVLGLAFIAVFIVSGDPGHQLLLLSKVAAVDLFNKRGRLFTAQFAGMSAIVINDHITAFGLAKGEAQIISTTKIHGYVLKYRWNL